MLSRVADSPLYWMSRYVERAENIARFIDVNPSSRLDLADGTEQWLPLVETTGDDEYFKETATASHAGQRSALSCFDPATRNSICSCLRAARENARSRARGHLLGDVGAVNTFYLMVPRPPASRTRCSPIRRTRLLDHVKLAAQLFWALADTMSHNEAWHFMRSGGCWSAPTRPRASST
jgi:uncharacterized alpha-E superfamily protein